MGRGTATAAVVAVLLWTLPCAFVAAAQEGPVYRVERRLANVTFTVTDSRGAPVSGLEREDFRVYEDGAPRETAAFSREQDLPLTLGLLFETKEVSASFLAESRRLTLEFLQDALRPADRVFLVAMRPDTRLLLDETGSLEEVEAVFENLDDRVRAAPVWRSGFGYKILDDMAMAVERKLALRQGRKAILLIQGGWDWRSKTTRTELIEQLQAADVIVYHVKIPNTIDKVRYVSPVIAPLDLLFIRRPMARICAETGGVQFGDGNPVRDFETIERELRSSYTVAFRPGRATADGKLHKISIECRKRGTHVRCRPAYRDTL